MRHEYRGRGSERRSFFRKIITQSACPARMALLVRLLSGLGPCDKQRLFSLRRYQSAK